MPNLSLFSYFSGLLFSPASSLLFVLEWFVNLSSLLNYKTRNMQEHGWLVYVMLMMPISWCCRLIMDNDRTRKFWEKLLESYLLLPSSLSEMISFHKGKWYISLVHFICKNFCSFINYHSLSFYIWCRTTRILATKFDQEQNRKKRYIFPLHSSLILQKNSKTCECEWHALFNSQNFWISSSSIFVSHIFVYKGV